jgi:hypothetical protein
MNKINWKLWAGRAVSVLVSLFFMGLMATDGSQAFSNTSEAGFSIMDWLPVTGESLMALLGAVVPFFLHRFFPDVDGKVSDLPKQLLELVTSAIALSKNLADVKAQRNFWVDFLDVAFLLLPLLPLLNSQDIKATLTLLGQQIHDALGPGKLPSPVVPPMPPAPPPPTDLAEAVANAVNQQVAA